MKPQLPYKRTDRVGHQLQQILGEIATKNINLTRLGFVTFTKVTVSPDLRNAKVFFSVIRPKLSMSQIQIELNKLRKAFKKYLAPQLHLKNMPDLHFYYDETHEYHDKLESLFKSINKDRENDL